MNLKKHIQDWKTYTSIIYTIIEDDKIIASATLYFYADKPAELIIMNVYVNEAYRGLKYGNLLMSTLEEAARDEYNASVIYLWCERNTFMYDWYRSRNYHYHKPYEKDDNTDWLKRKVK